MADAKTHLEGLEISDEIKDQIAERLNPILTKLETDVSDSVGKLEDAIKTRDKAKTELRELREKFASGDFDGKKEMEALIKTKETEVASLSEKTTKLENDLEIAKTELGTTKTELETIQSETKLELKSRFTDVEWEKVKEWKIDALRIAAQMKPETATGDQSKRFNTYGVKGQALTAEEKIMKSYKSV